MKLILNNKEVKQKKKRILIAFGVNVTKPCESLFASGARCVTEVASSENGEDLWDGIQHRKCRLVAAAC